MGGLPVDLVAQSLSLMSAGGLAFVAAQAKDKSAELSSEGNPQARAWSLVWSALGLECESVLLAKCHV